MATDAAATRRIDWTSWERWAQRQAAIWRDIGISYTEAARRVATALALMRDNEQ